MVCYCMGTRPKTNNVQMKPVADRLWARVEIRGPDDCWEWQGSKHWRGHGQIGLGRRSDGLGYTHVVAWQDANGRQVPAGMCIRHKCDNPPCCNPAHLEIGTQLDNLRDMFDRRRHSFGEHHATKLSESDVVVIKEKIRGGIPHRVIAGQYGVSRSMVGAIGLGKRWSHVL